MLNRAKGKSWRTLEQFVRRGLCPCTKCLRAALWINPPSILSRRVYDSGTTDANSFCSRACKSCGFSLLFDGAFESTPDLDRKMHERKAEENSRGHDAPTDAGTQVSTGGGLLMRHGDSKTEFNTGAQRDTTEGKGRPSLISPVLIHRLGVHLAKGAEHYGDDNWAKGMPYRRTADSIIRHIGQWLAGDTVEDHLAAIAFGVMCLMHYEAESEGDRYPDDMDDRCKSFKEILPSLLTSVAADATIKVDKHELKNKFEGDRSGTK